MLIVNICLCCLACYLHGLLIEARISSGQLCIEVFFDDDSPAIEATVALLSSNDQTIAQGKTDQKGCWTIPCPAPGTYQITANAGLGHKSKKSISIPDNRQSAISMAPPKSTPGSIPNVSTASTARTMLPKNARAPATQRVSDGPTREELQETYWLRVLIGLLIISGVSLAGWLALRSKRRS